MVDKLDLDRSGRTAVYGRLHNNKRRRSGLQRTESGGPESLFRQSQCKAVPESIRVCQSGCGNNYVSHSCKPRRGSLAGNRTALPRAEYVTPIGHNAKQFLNPSAFANPAAATTTSATPANLGGAPSQVTGPPYRGLNMSLQSDTMQSSS